MESLQVFDKFSKLDEEEQERVGGNPRLDKFSSRAKEVYLFLARHRNDAGDGEFVIPSMVAAPMMGYEMTNSYKVTQDILKKHGREGIEWKNLSGAVIFKDTTERIFKIPGVEGGILKFTKSRGNHKYPFLTLPFTRMLAVRGSTALCKEIAELTIVMHDLLADKVEEQMGFAEIKGIKQTHPRWQELRNDSRYMTNAANKIIQRIGGPKLSMEINQFLNRKVIGTSSSDARNNVEGMRKGETVRNITKRPNLSVLRDIQDQFTYWLEERDEEGIETSYDEVMEYLAKLVVQRRGALESTRGQGLLKHPGGVINKNGTINPSGYKRAQKRIGDGTTPHHLLAETNAAKKRRIANAPKPNPFLKFGFVVKT